MFVETHGAPAVLPAGLRAAPRTRSPAPLMSGILRQRRRALSGVRSGPCNARRCRNSTTASAAGARQLSGPPPQHARRERLRVPRPRLAARRARSAPARSARQPARPVRQLDRARVQPAQVDPGRAGGRPVGLDGLRRRAAQARRAGRLRREPRPGRSGAPATASASSAATRACATNCCSRRCASRGVGSVLAQTLRGAAARGAFGAGPAAGAPRISPGSVRWCSWSRTSICRWPRSSGCSASLAQHELVPVVLWDPLEFELTPRAGWRRCATPRSGQRRLVWWRPALREQWAAHHLECREALLHVFRAHRLRPLFIEGAFSAEAVTRHFHS